MRREGEIEEIRREGLWWKDSKQSHLFPKIWSSLPSFCLLSLFLCIRNSFSLSLLFLFQSLSFTLSTFLFLSLLSFCLTLAFYLSLPLQLSLFTFSRSLSLVISAVSLPSVFIPEWFPPQITSYKILFSYYYNIEDEIVKEREREWVKNERKKGVYTYSQNFCVFRNQLIRTDACKEYRFWELNFWRFFLYLI